MNSRFIHSYRISVPCEMFMLNRRSLTFLAVGVESVNFARSLPVTQFSFSFLQLIYFQLKLMVKSGNQIQPVYIGELPLGVGWGLR